MAMTMTSMSGGWGILAAVVVFLILLLWQQRNRLFIASSSSSSSSPSPSPSFLLSDSTALHFRQRFRVGFFNLNPLSLPNLIFSSAEFKRKTVGRRRTLRHRKEVKEKQRLNIMGFIRPWTLQLQWLTFVMWFSQLPRTSNFVTDADLKFLMEILDEKLNESDKWENVLDKRNNLLSYNVKCCKPKNGPLRYLSKTVFNDISSEMLRNFYMDNDYRKQWDKTLVQHNQLQVDKSDGTEVGHTIKKFPLLKPREYVLAWKLWEGSDKTFYCFMKECEHPLAPRQRKYVRVELFRSGWQIREVPGSNACEITMFHQEDAGLNMEMAKLAFRKGIWNYVCKMDDALRRYSVISYRLTSSVTTSLNLMQKVPACLDPIRSNISPTHAHPTVFHDQVTDESQMRMIRRPSRKFLANSLLLIGGAICLSRGHSSLGAKVAMAYIVTKLSKRGARSNQTKQS
ncbi:StAR-related lipid transfer protein 7, mitochondrial, partial [Mucuna pruriens]